MAVINTIDDALSYPADTAETTGARILEVIKVITIVSGDTDASKFFIAEVPDMALLERIELECPAITGGTDYDIGLFDTKGNVILADCFANGLDMSDVTGLPVGPLGDSVRQGMTAVTLANAGKRVFEHAGHVNKALPASGETNRLAKYRIGLTANTIGSADATIVARVRYLMCA